MANNIIVLTRGDTFDFDVTAYEELYGNFYSYAQEGDYLEFKLMYPNQDYFDENVPLFLEEQIVAGEHNDNCPVGCTQDHIMSYTFELNHDHTIKLPIGTYYYAVKLRRPATNNQPVQYLTLVNKTKFIING